MKVIVGAEAKIIIKENIVIKERIRKRYRHPILDKKLIRERTNREKKTLETLSNIKIPVPKIISEEKNTLILEKIDGAPLKDILYIKEKHTEEIAKIIAKIHNHNIIHGDLTLKNILLSKDDKIYLIDFGLSYFSSRYEDKAMDIYVLEESTKDSIFDMVKFYEIYFSNVNHRDQIKSRLERIKKRRRYLS